MKRSIAEGNAVGILRIAAAAAVLGALSGLAGTASAQYTPPATYPADSAFTPVTCSGMASNDSCTDDARDHRNIVGAGASPAYLYAQDGTYLFLRLRVEDDPRQDVALVAFAWGFGLDTDGNGAFEAYVSLIGQGMSDRLEIQDQDASNGTTPSLALMMGGGGDTSLRPILTDFSGATWAQVTPAPPAGTNFCADDTDGGDFYITVAVPLAALADFGALGALVAYGGSSSEFSGIQNDFVCATGSPPNCTVGTMCASGVCLTGVGSCGPSIDPIPTGCIAMDRNMDGVHEGCSSVLPYCLVGGGTSRCVQCLMASHCNDANACTTDACTANSCTTSAIGAGTACPGGVCNGSASTPMCVPCVDDRALGMTDSGCSAGAPTCDTSGMTPRCVGCITAADCDDGNACTLDACALGACSRTPIPAGTSCAGGICNGSVSGPQCVPCIDDRAPGMTDTGCTSGTPMCDTSGAVPVCRECIAASDCNDGNACTADQCTGGACSRTTIPAGTACAGGVCNGSSSAPSCEPCIDDAAPGATDSGCTVLIPLCDTSGATPVCVACLSAADCNDGNSCTTDACTAGACSSTPQSAGSACTGGVCDTTPSCVPCIDDSAGTATDTGCSLGTPVCDTSGAMPRCVACTTAAHCDDGNACTADACTAGACSSTAIGAGTACPGGVCDSSATAPLCVPCIDDAGGTMLDTGCTAGAPVCDESGPVPTCVGCSTGADCEDGSECTTDACIMGVCGRMPVAAGSACTGGVCDGASACVPCVDDAPGVALDTGCMAAMPVCDESGAAPRCVECTAAADCDDADDCTADACNAGGGCESTAEATGTLCAAGVCDGSAGCVPCIDDAAGTMLDTGCTAAVPACDESGAMPRCVVCLSAADCDDGNECTADGCTAGACASTSGTAGTTCSTGVCDGAATDPGCVPCIDDATGLDTGCSAGAPSCDTSGAVPRCVGCTSDAACDDGNECTADACVAGACETMTELPGTACTGGVCDGAAGGVCVPCVDDQAGSVRDAGCTSTAPLCERDPGGAVRCVPCADGGPGLDPGCMVPDEVCDESGTTPVCVPCEDTGMLPAVDFGCEAGTPVCASVMGRNRCVECELDAHCPGGELCDGATGTCAPACVIDSDCPSTAPVCDVAAGVCRECTLDAHCPGRRVCGPGGTCGPPDRDGDGITDDVDLDDDDDGIPDAAELGGMDRSLDADDDGVQDFEDPDAVTCTDAGADGICDTLPREVDFDGDGLPNHLDLDADGDGLTDLREGGGTDSDGDGIVDDQRDANGDGYDDGLMASPLPLPDTDDAGGPDFLDLDADGDGLTDVREADGVDEDGDGRADGADTDGDGLAGEADPDDGGAAWRGPDTDRDGQPDWRDVDADGDGAPDATEGTDDDFDGRPDREPAGEDRDGDGIDDAFDVEDGGVAPTEPDRDEDGTPDWRDLDDDGDRVPSEDEDEDDDGDPRNDDTDGDGTPNYLDTDDDGDGLSTIDEDVDDDGDPRDDDTDGDGTPDYLDPATPTLGGFSGGALCAAQPATGSPIALLAPLLALLGLVVRRRSRGPRARR